MREIAWQLQDRDDRSFTWRPAASAAKMSSRSCVRFVTATPLRPGEREEEYSMQRPDVIDAESSKIGR